MILPTMKAWKSKQRFKKKKEAGVEKNSFPTSRWSRVFLVYIMQLIFQKGREFLILNIRIISSNRFESYHHIIKSRIRDLLYLYPEWDTKVPDWIRMVNSIKMAAGCIQRNTSTFHTIISVCREIILRQTFLNQSN